MKTVLYLDDSTCALRLLERILADTMQVFCCPTSSEAGALMEQNHIDCFVLDQMLGDGDGITFARKVRATERYRETPIILLSAGITPEIAHRAMRYRINQCVNKPFSPQQIREAISSQIAQPTIHQVDLSTISALCAAWEADGLHFQYSPDLGRLVSAKTPEEVHALMHDALQEWVVQQGQDTETVLDLGTVQHSFDVDCPVAQG